MRRLVRGIWTDQQGGEVLEYALIIGAIAVAALVLVTSYGSKVLARWQNVDSSM